MVPNRNRDLIQAEAYRELAELVKNSGFGSLQTLRNLVARTDERLKAESFDVQAVLDELWRTRLKRLPNTSFNYWPMRGPHPKIALANGQTEVLQERHPAFQLKLDQHLSSRLEQYEHDLFGPKGSDACDVFWFGADANPGPWQVHQCEESNQLLFVARYCVAYRHDGAAHVDSKDHPKLKVINLDTHHLDGTERSTNIRPRSRNVYTTEESQ